jgi:TolB protein
MSRMAANSNERGTAARVQSALETLDIATGERRCIYRTRDHIEAPNWSRDGAHFLFNRDGLIYRLPVQGGEPERVETGALHRLNNDHGISPDGTLLAVSDQSQLDGASRIHVVPIGGGAPHLVTKHGPSYWHGWSPDGKRLAYVASRRGSDLDIYTCCVEGGEEQRLTDTPGLDDGPDYSPDGRYIYFNSLRSGNMKIWRMRADGSEQEQCSFGEETRDWFAHPSPDGRWIVFIAFGMDVALGDHPANKNVSLMMMPAQGGAPRLIATLFGGQGTINVPSWSPDGRAFAFVSYELLA